MFRSEEQVAGSLLGTPESEKRHMCSFLQEARHKKPPKRLKKHESEPNQ